VPDRAVLPRSAAAESRMPRSSRNFIRNSRCCAGGMVSSAARMVSGG
jgi:hypothetical protein